MQKVAVLQELQLRGQTRPDSCPIIDELITLISDDNKWPLVAEFIQHCSDPQDAVQLLIETHQ